MSTLSLFQSSKPGAASAGGGRAAAPAMSTGVGASARDGGGLDPSPAAPFNSNPIEGHEGAGVAPEDSPAPREPSAVGIYEMTAGSTTIVWLCALHLAARLAGIWMSAKRIGDVDADFECDDCDRERQNERSAL